MKGLDMKLKLKIKIKSKLHVVHAKEPDQDIQLEDTHYSLFTAENFPSRFYIPVLTKNNR
jgi:hypothetical protein